MLGTRRVDTHSLACSHLLMPARGDPIPVFRNKGPVDALTCGCYGLLLNIVTVPSLLQPISELVHLACQSTKSEALPGVH